MQIGKETFQGLSLGAKPPDRETSVATVPDFGVQRCIREFNRWFVSMRPCA
jgi:hypothetical protein